MIFPVESCKSRLPLVEYCLQAEDHLVEQVEAEKDAVLAQVRGQMSDMRQQHHSMAAELQRKLAWWVTCPSEHHHVQI